MHIIMSYYYTNRPPIATPHAYWIRVYHQATQVGQVTRLLPAYYQSKWRSRNIRKHKIKAKTKPKHSVYTTLNSSFIFLLASCLFIYQYLSLLFPYISTGVSFTKNIFAFIWGLFCFVFQKKITSMLSSLQWSHCTTRRAF